MIRFAVLLLLTGCAVTQITQTAPDVYLLAKQSPQVGFGPPVSQKTDVYLAAAEHCRQFGKQVDTVKTEETPSGFGRMAVFSLEFRCK